MVSAKSLFYLLLIAAPALAAPAPAPAAAPAGTLEVRADKILTCQNTGGNIKISSNKAEGNVHAAPLNEKTASGYPHHFQNNKGDIIKFPNKACNAKGVKLLEYPVFADGHLYPSGMKPKADPGPARAIYTTPHKDFCGVIAHTEKDNKGPFKLCE
ncbi:MAG: hypothetical protein M1816_000615 [Peltula sp. TS41687]|nr:MAG: hypothetical protein M1816_000615 [Peltula sp. TS41687]